MNLDTVILKIMIWILIFLNQSDDQMVDIFIERKEKCSITGSPPYTSINMDCGHSLCEQILCPTCKA